MRHFYIKKGELFLHIRTNEYVDYQDYSDINTMYTMQLTFCKEKDGAKKFSDIQEASIFLTKNSKKLKNVIIIQE